MGFSVGAPAVKGAVGSLFESSKLIGKMAGCLFHYSGLKDEFIPYVLSLHHPH